MVMQKWEIDEHTLPFCRIPAAPVHFVARQRSLLLKDISLQNVGLYKMVYLYICELGENILE